MTEMLRVAVRAGIEPFRQEVRDHLAGVEARLDEAITTEFGVERVQHEMNRQVNGPVREQGVLLRRVHTRE